MGAYLIGLSTAPFVICVTLTALGGCSYQSEVSAPAVAPAGNVQVAVSTPLKVSAELAVGDKHPKEIQKSVVIESVSVYGWWWSDDQLEHDFNADNPPPKESYIKLDKWDASQPDSPHPDRIDLICRLGNHTNQPVDLSIEASADFKVASYDEIAPGAGTQQAVDEKLKRVQWSDNQPVAKLDVGTLLPNESREVSLKDFHLRSVIDKYFRPAAGDLWPWKLRISITVKDSKGVRTAFNSLTIDLIPAD